MVPNLREKLEKALRINLKLNFHDCSITLADNSHKKELTMNSTIMVNNRLCSMNDHMEVK